MKDAENYNTFNGKPKTSNLSERDNRNIFYLASNLTKSLNQIKNKLNLKVDRETVRKLPHANTYIIILKMK